MAPYTSTMLPPQEPSIESLILDDDILMAYGDENCMNVTMEVVPIKIDITPARPSTTHRKSFSFSWENFPLLHEDCIYVDSCWQKRKAAIAQTELVSSSASQEEPVQATMPQHKRKPVHKRSKTIATAGAFTAVATARKTRVSKKTVRFDAVHIREHSITIGNHDW